MTDLTSNSQIFTSSTSEQHATFSDYFNHVVVVDDDVVSLWVNTDGSTVTDAEAGSVEVPPGDTAQIANEQVRSYPFKVGAGGDPANIGGTPQQNTPASGHGTYVSFISDSGATAKSVTVSAQ